MEEYQLKAKSREMMQMEKKKRNGNMFEVINKTT